MQLTTLRAGRALKFVALVFCLMTAFVLEYLFLLFAPSVTVSAKVAIYMKPSNRFTKACRVANSTLDRPAGSHSLAVASQHRGVRWA